MTLSAGAKLGRYEIRSKIGEGGMGEVYLAQDTKLDRKVAIKFLPVDSQGDERANRRLLREAQAAAKLDHQNICAVHEVGEEDGRRFIVMPYVEGETLDVRMQRKSLDLSQSLAIAAQVADALAEAHAHGIIHRDIKPSNIIISLRGQAKVMDFGLAKLSVMGAGDGLKVDAEASTQALLTAAGTIIGTMPYMSPEQAHGQPLDARTDIFSFGVLLYEMLTGRQLFAAGSPAGTISAILTKEPEPLAQYISLCPPELQRIVSKCLEKDRERRYQTIREVATDLENVRVGYASGISKLMPSREESDAGARETIRDYVPPRTAFITSRRTILVGCVIFMAALASVFLLSRNFRKTPAATSTTVKSAPHDNYLRAKVLLRSENREDNETATKLLEQAVDADPSLAVAWAELARAYNSKAFYYAPEEAKELSVKAQVANERALQLDPNLAEAHLVRGVLLWTHANRFPHEQAIQSYKRALSLDPKLDEAHHQLGLVYFHIGLLDKGWAEIEKAVDTNPSNTYARFRFGVINLYRAKYEDALRVFNSTPLEKNPSLWAFQTATALFQLGRDDEASTLIEKYLRDYSKDEGGVGTSVKAMILAKAGKSHEAEEAIQQAQDLGKDFGHFHHTTYNIASAYALMNKPDEALKWLQFTIEDGFPCYPLFENDANLKNLRKDERFIAFIAKLKQRWERYKATV